MAAAYTVVRQARQQLIKKFSTSGVIRTTSGDVTQSPMASQHSRSNRVSSFAEDPCESAQLSAEEKLVELQASKIRVNARGLRYPDDGPLPEVLPTSSDQDNGKEAETMRSGVMNRKFISTSGVIWEKESLVLNRERLLIANAGDPKNSVFDDILLRDVIECELKEDEKNSDNLEVIFRTEPHGYNAGRSYIYSSAYQNSVDWEDAVDDAVANAKAKHQEDFMQFTYGHSKFAMFRARTKLLYNHTYFQYFFALMILGGFVQDMLESQMVPEIATGERRKAGGSLGDTGDAEGVNATASSAARAKTMEAFLVAESAVCMFYTLVTALFL
jgi:hypothetical protein